MDPVARVVLGYDNEERPGDNRSSVQYLLHGIRATDMRAGQQDIHGG